jgi:hypothetical protein
LSSGRAAFARVGRAGSFFGLSGGLAITPNMGRVLRRGKRMYLRGKRCRYYLAQAFFSGSDLARVFRTEAGVN